MVKAMKSITIRNIEPIVAEKLKQEAKNQGKSINLFVVDMIEQNLGFKKRRKYSNTYRDLDHLFGKWTDEEYRRIQDRIDAGRNIDRELWE